MMRRLAVALTVALALFASACDVRTANAPDGGLELTAHFDDVRNLVPGHAVKVSDVIIGAVVDVSLDGYVAVVTMALDPDQDIPAGTSAILRKTSLLGENFVELVLPGPDAMANGPFLASGDVIDDTHAASELEDVSQQAIEIISAIAVDDIAGVVDALDEAFVGRGGQLNDVIATLSGVVDVYAGQKDDLGAAIDGFASFGRDLADGAGEFEGLIDEVVLATDALAIQRTRMIDTLRELTGLARALNDEVLTPHLATLTKVLKRLDPVAAQLALESETLNALVSALARFGQNVERSIVGDQVNIFGYLMGPPTPTGGEQP